MPLEDFMVETFAGRLGERFRLERPGEAPLDLELIECEAVASPGPEEIERPGRHVPFSLVFLGPDDPVLPQATYRIRHDDLVEFDLFLVPIGRDERGTSYEAVFS